VPGVSITFAIRGPILTEFDYLYRASRGGGARIEIIDKQYKVADCLKAVLDFPQNLTDNITNCMGEGLHEDAGKTTPSKGKVYLDIVSRCYSNPTQIVSDNVVLSDCRKRYSKIYNSDPARVKAGTGDDICGGNVDHMLTANYDANKQLLPDSKGFIGSCADTGGGLSTEYKKCTNAGDPAQGGICCAEQQAENFCRDLTNPALMDPAASALVGSNLNIPSSVLDAGVYSVNGVAATLLVRVLPPVTPEGEPTAPTGLIQEFSNDINFGAMIFNENGAGQECKTLDKTAKNGGLADGEIPCTMHCIKATATPADSGRECQQDKDCTGLDSLDWQKSGYSCRAIPGTDGGRVVAPVNSIPGDHSSGLVAAIDQIAADSWTPLAEAFYNAIGYFAGRADLRLQPGDFALPPAGQPGYSCRSNNVLIVSDGVSTADRHPDVMALVRDTPHPASWTTTLPTAPLPPSQGSYNLDDLAWIARNYKIVSLPRSPAGVPEPAAVAKDYLSSYVVYTGHPCGDYQADGSCRTEDEGVAEKMMQLTASKGGGKIVSVKTPLDQKKVFRAMLQEIAAGSGGDSSILSTGTGNGALFLQQQYYPAKSFDGGTTSASWTGEMLSLWYYIDPFLGGSGGAASSVREDTVQDSRLNLRDDRIVDLRQDQAVNRSYAYLTADSNGDGLGEGAATRVETDQLKTLWRAGRQLWARNLASEPRTIYTPLLPGGVPTGGGLMQFSYLTPGDPSRAGNSSVLRPYLQQPDDAGAVKLIQYLHGFDFPGDASLRDRSVAVKPALAGDPEKGVWKLGDISATPQVQSPVALGSYQLPPPQGYADASYGSFINSVEYRNRGMVYAGANDGMLHAFDLGKLTSGSGAVKATLAGNPAGQVPGREKWAFIPKNALPYLKYLADPNYRHLYYLDGKGTLIDASIGDTNADSCREGYWACDKPSVVVNTGNHLLTTENPWRTVLIVGMGVGGASARTCGAGSNCVPTPAGDPADPTAGLGYSSYFALDVSDPSHPALLWEFSDPSLGFSTTGPAIVRVGDADKNGRWFALFGSGPTGPIDPATHQFLGRSDQPLKFFVVDLRTGALVTTVTPDPPINSAFAGSLQGGAIDADRWSRDKPGRYQDDALYTGFVKKRESDGTWSAGGVGRISMTSVDTPSDENVRGIWKWSTVLDGIGPVTAGVARLQDRKSHRLWLYFGTGRYFFSQDDLASAGHTATRRAIYGVKEPCYHRSVLGVLPKSNEDGIDPACTDAISQPLSDQTDPASPDPAPGDPGWFIALDPGGTGTLGAERLVTNPTSSTGGAVFFPTFQPSLDLCLFGDSYLWGVKYDTGKAMGALQGMALVQLSTGELHQSTLSGMGGRRSDKMTGKPNPVKLVTNSGLKPLKKIIHIQER
jgi:type IV pilus assembly protein PilY1